MTNYTNAENTGGSDCSDELKKRNHNYKRIRECGGVVVERRTPNREVLGSIPTGVIVLSP